MGVNSEECLFIQARTGQMTVLILGETMRLVKFCLCTTPNSTNAFHDNLHWDILGMFP